MLAPEAVDMFCRTCLEAHANQISFDSPVSQQPANPREEPLDVYV
jgi:hypothetical protein